jgi:hypothetical protein
MRGWVIRACAEIAENTEKNGRKIDKSLCVLRVLSGKFCVFLQNQDGAATFQTLG